ncbi:hypothetical protein ACTOB_005565 [Actinoplanes oblitus]|uniref:DUF6891 domain-containing protein n=1 Tax=Actinoplanes oblitus TaxID=3040509 RepID=A0ABY8W9E0_9ACTN|nr:hypothetical protein [Actinoplanes oblitus]WIM93582.1 hypothetical protein ACTOB_005565 [Actinoplanes oblitus]
MNAWPYNDRPDGARFLPGHIAEPGRTEIEDEIWAWIVRGETDPAEYVRYLDEERHGATDEDLTAGYTRALDIRRAQQRAWGEVRSNLTLAFIELNRLGVLARENFACCGTCAAAEIHDERDDSRHWRGYLWYHQQDTESLAESETGSVYLGYGAYPPADLDRETFDALPDAEKQARYQAEVEHLMDEVVFPVLHDHGMRVTWNRSLSTRILLTGAHWYAPIP